MWEPDCTYAEIQAAYQAGKTIVVDAYGNSVNTTADGEWDDSNSQLTYQVYDYNSHLNVLSEYRYTFNSTGISESSNTAYMPPNLAYLTKTYTPTESEQTDYITIPSGKTGIGEVDITIEPISNSYIGSGITQRSSSDLTASGATVTAPAGYYANAATKTISSGTEGTPIASKGTVTNHTLSVTPSVTNAAGYIAGGTHTGTAITVSASELVSGTYNVDSSGTKDVTNYASVSIPTGTAGTPSATKGTASNNQITVTPSVTNTTGYISGSTKTGTAVTVSASELVSGSETKTANGTYDVTNLASLVVNVPSSGGGVGTLLATKSLGTLSTTVTSAQNTNQTLNVTNYNDYDLLIVDTSVDSITNNRHTSTVVLILLTGTSNVNTKNTYTIGSNKWNSKLNSSGTGSTRQSTTAYGVYPYSVSASSGTLTITIYYRYNSTYTGTLNGSYTMRVYGLKLYDLIGG